MLESIPNNPFPNNKLLFGALVALFGAAAIVLLMKYCVHWSELKQEPEKAPAASTAPAGR